MKKYVFACVAFWLAAAACDQHKSLTIPAANRAGLFNLAVAAQYVPAGTLSSAGYSRSIPIDTANRMIGSYLDAIDYTVNTDAIRSWVFNADTLRAYLGSTKGKEIKNIKLMLAHSLEYIHEGNEGIRPPLNSHALTLVIVGLDENNNYIYSTEDGPYNRCMPCPPDCLPIGEGSGDLLTP